MFLDASVLAAVLLQEEDAPSLLKAMEAARGKLWVSPVVRLETVLALVRRKVEARGIGPATASDFEAATQVVDALLAALGARDMHITSSIGSEAIRTLSVYGKVVGHAARLNVGDAYSYACAKAYHAALLYKGNDFAQTDLA